MRRTALFGQKFSILGINGELQGAFIFKGEINVAADFPTLAEVKNGWTYRIGTDVTDNDDTKTNTNQSFSKGAIIAWAFGTPNEWVDITGLEVWTDDGSKVFTINDRPIDMQSKGLLSDDVATEVKLGDVGNTSFNTINKTIIGAVNEVAADAAITAKKEPLPIITLGQTVFTLSQTPSGPDALSIFVNRIMYNSPLDYTVSGTTLTWNDPLGFVLDPDRDKMWAWYDFQAGAGGSLDQSQIYYVGDSGNDINDGKSVEFPFLTISAAIAAILLQTPSPTNRFEIQVIGAPNSDVGTIILPPYTSLIHRSGQITGIVELGQGCYYFFDDMVIPATATGIVGDGITAYVEGNHLTAAGPDVIGIELNQSTLYCHIENSDLSSTGSKTYDLLTNVTLYLSGRRSREDQVSTKQATSSVFIDWQDYSTAQHTIIHNEKGNVDIDAKGKNIILRDSANGQIFTNIKQFPRFPNLPAVVARTSSPIVGLTGDGTNATVIFNYEDLDHAGNYDNATGIFTPPVKGYYSINVVLFLEGLTINNDDLRIQVYSSTQSPTILWLKPTTLAPPSQPDKLIVNASVDLLLIQNENIDIRLEVDGEISKNVGVGVPSYFNCKLVTAVT